MKKFLLALPIIAAGGWLAVSPYIAANTLKNDIQAGNGQAVVEKIDFDDLKISIKEEISRISLAQSNGNEQMAAMGASFMGQMVDQYITPTSIKELVENIAQSNQPQRGIPSSGGARGPAIDPENISFSRSGLATTTISLIDPNDPRKTVDVYMTLEGLTWKISGLKLQDDFSL